MGGACNTYGGKGKARYEKSSAGKTCSDHVGDLGVGGRIILKLICKEEVRGRGMHSSSIRMGSRVGML